MNELMVENGNRAATEPRANVWFTPRFDLFEDDDAYVLMGDLPGVEARQLSVKFEKNELSIHGKVEPRRASGPYFVQEYGVGDFHRAFPIGDFIESSLVEAELKDGVLTVRLPKRPEVRPRKINVRAG